MEYSLTRFQSQSSYSSEAYTESSNTSSAYTYRGTGTIPAKFFFAVGSATLRGVEYVVVRRRLTVISSKFPHLDTVASDRNLDQMYDDLLELTRPGLYPESIRMYARRLLLGQIGARQPKDLIQALLRWHPVEVELFLIDLSQRFLALWDAKSPKSSGLKPYFDAQPVNEIHGIAPMVEFLSQLIQLDNTDISRIVLQTGTLDILLHLYCTNFCDVGKFGIARLSLPEALLTSCTQLLYACITAKDPEVLAMVLAHPVRALWTPYPFLPFTLAFPERSRQRIETWASIDLKYIWWRLCSITESDLMSNWDQKMMSEGWLFDIIVDLLDISSVSLNATGTFNAVIIGRALRILHSCMSLARGFFTTSASSHCRLRSHQENVNLYSFLLENLSLLMPPNTPSNTLSRAFFVDSDVQDYKDAIIFRFIHGFSKVASFDDDFFTTISAAGMLSFLAAYTSAAPAANSRREEQFARRDKFLSYSHNLFNRLPQDENWKEVYVADIRLYEGPEAVWVVESDILQLPLGLNLLL